MRARRRRLRWGLFAAGLLLLAGAAVAEWSWLRFAAARARTAGRFSGNESISSDRGVFRGEPGERLIPLAIGAPDATVIAPESLELPFDAEGGYQLHLVLHQFEGPHENPVVLRIGLEGERAAEVQAQPGGGLDPYAIEHGRRAVYEAVVPGKTRCGRNVLEIAVAGGSWIALEDIDVNLVEPRGLARAPRLMSLAALGLLLAGCLAASRAKDAALPWPRLGLVLFGVLLGLALAEIALRATESRIGGARRLLYRSGESASPTGHGILEDLRAHRCAGKPCGLAPCGFRLNHDGLHTSDYARSKKPGSFRLVGIGDSFMNTGGPVPHRDEWFVRLAETLRERRSQPVEDIDLGLPCIGLPTELRVLREEALELQPDLVVWSVYVGNDLLDEEDERHRARSPSATKPWLDHLLVWRLASGVVRLAALDASQLMPSCGARPAAGGAACGKLEIGDEPYDPSRKSGTDAWYRAYATSRVWQLYERHQHAAVEEAIAGAAERFAEAKNALGAVPALVILIPDELQVSESRLSDVLSWDPALHRADLDLEFTTRGALHGLTAAGFEVVDLTGPFRDALARGENPYQPNDSHLSRAGNQLAARLVGEALDRLVPAQTAQVYSASIVSP